MARMMDIVEASFKVDQSSILVYMENVSCIYLLNVGRDDTCVSYGPSVAG